MLTEAREAMNERYSATVRPAHPNASPRNRVAYRQMTDALRHAAAGYARGRMLDIGCGQKPWRGIFAPHVNEHVGADHASTPHPADEIDIVASAYEIPLPDASFDTVLLTEVLEHLETPAVAIEEATRLLRAGGHLILTTPFAWPLHEEPRDFFRYSPHGLRHLAEGAGLEVVELRPLGGAWTTSALLLSWALYRVRRRPFGKLVEILVVLLQRAATAVERRSPLPAMSWNHLLVARKP